MAKVQNTFLKSKMNKDLDARLLPEGEYRDARNAQVSKSDYNKLTRCKLTAPTEKYPLAYTDTGNFRPSFTPYFKIFPLPTSVEVNCVVTPNPPAWNFRTASQGQYVYSPSASRDFSLSKVEQTNIIINILKYAGVIINDPTIIDVAAQESAKVQANEKS